MPSPYIFIFHPCPHSCPGWFSSCSCPTHIITLTSSLRTPSPAVGFSCCYIYLFSTTLIPMSLFYSSWTDDIHFNHVLNKYSSRDWEQGTTPKGATCVDVCLSVRYRYGASSGGVLLLPFLNFHYTYISYPYLVHTSCSYNISFHLRMRCFVSCTANQPAIPRERCLKAAAAVLNDGGGWVDEGV